MKGSPEMKQPIVRALFQASFGSWPASLGLLAKNTPSSGFAYVCKEDTSLRNVGSSIRERTASFSPALANPKIPVIPVKIA